LIVCARDEGREAITAGLGIATPGGGGAPPAVGVREHVITEGNESVLRMVKYVCEVYGVDLTSVKVVGSKKDGVEAEQDSHIDDDPDSHSTPLFGWPELQVGAVREAVAVAEALPGEDPFRVFRRNSLLVYRLPYCCTICIVHVEDIAPTFKFTGTTTSLRYVDTGIANRSSARR